MGGTKIVVVQLKDLIKKGLFSVIGIAIVIMLIYFFVPREKPVEQSNALFIPGTYSAEIILHNSPVRVDVAVTENEIISIELLNMDETQTVFYPLFEPTMDNLSKEIVKNQTLNVVTSNENAMTENILLSAIRTALAKAEYQPYDNSQDFH